MVSCKARLSTEGNNHKKLIWFLATEIESLTQKLHTIYVVIFEQNLQNLLTSIIKKYFQKLVEIILKDTSHANYRFLFSKMLFFQIFCKLSFENYYIYGNIEKLTLVDINSVIAQDQEDQD